MGAVYPSDCLISLIPIAIIIGMLELLPFMNGGCPNCITGLANGEEAYVNICYYSEGNKNNNNVIPGGTITSMTRYNFKFLEDNYGRSIWFITIGFIIFMAVSNYPLEFWSKSPYFFGTILAIYMFYSLLLCPTSHNDFKAVGFVTPK